MKNAEPRLIDIDIAGTVWQAWQWPDGRIRPHIAGASDANPNEPAGGGVVIEETPAPAPAAPEGRGTITIEEEPPEPQRGLSPEVAAAVEKARQEEKDKLYPRLQALEEQLEEQRKAREAEQAERDRQEQERIAAEEAERQRLSEEELDVRSLLQKKEQEWEQRFSESQAQIEHERAVFEMERQFQSLQQYRSQAIAAAQEDLMPELIEDFIPVTLTSQEAIDAAVDRCREKSLSIVQQMQQRTQEIRRSERGVSPTGEPPVGPMENQTSQRVLTGDDIKNMSIEEYAKNRDKILQSVSERARVHGPYGV